MDRGVYCFPYPCSYWVVPGKRLAGFLGDLLEGEASAGTDALISAGMCCIADLMEVGGGRGAVREMAMVFVTTG